MEHCIRKPRDEKEIPACGRDIEQTMRLRIRDTIGELVKEELDTALGPPKSVRVGEQRQGHRQGMRERALTTSLGPATFAMPWAGLQPARQRWGGVATSTSVSPGFRSPPGAPGGSDPEQTSVTRPN